MVDLFRNWVYAKLYRKFTFKWSRNDLNRNKISSSITIYIYNGTTSTFNRVWRCLCNSISISSSSSSSWSECIFYHFQVYNFHLYKVWALSYKSPLAVQCLFRSFACLIAHSFVLCSPFFFNPECICKFKVQLIVYRELVDTQSQIGSDETVTEKEATG